jgi:hypothetical protein
VGIAVAFSNATTFYLTDYNEVHLSGQSGIDEQDTPYTLTIIETVVSVLTVIIGMLAIQVPRKIDRKCHHNRVGVFISIIIIYRNARLN